MCAWEWREGVLLQEVENALAEQIGNNADVVAVVEALLEMNASILVGLVVCY